MNNSFAMQKAQKEHSIINAAEELFCTKGYENTSMDELAKRSNCTKRTLYRYFVCKQDIYFAVILKGHKRMFAHVKDKSREGEDGLSKLKLRLDAYRVFYLASPNFFDLASLIRAVKLERNPNELPFFHQYNKFIGEMRADIVSLFKEAKADDSIRCDVEVSKLALAVIMILSGFLSMLSASWDSYKDPLDLDKEDFMDLSFSLIFEILLKEREQMLSLEDN